MPGSRPTHAEIDLSALRHNFKEIRQAVGKDCEVLAVIRVTTNRGKNTPGVDGIRWRSPARKLREARRLNQKDHKAQPLLRKYIPEGNNKKRPLGIPTFKARAE